jgi:hypothetical protein
MKTVEWPFEEDVVAKGSGSFYSVQKIAAASDTVSDLMQRKSIDFVINLPIVGAS